MLDPTMEKELRDICNDLEKQGKIICASECNNAKDTIPAIYKSVIGVGELLPDVKKKVLVDRAASVQVLADISRYLLRENPDDIIFLRELQREMLMWQVFWPELCKQHRI